MSAPKFTPGEWEYEDGSVTASQPDGRDRTIIAELRMPGITSEKLAEYRANGRVLAASPNLYSACHALIYVDDLQVAIDLARAALAKARGEG